jgi:hypothetical protein
MSPDVALMGKAVLADESVVELVPRRIKVMIKIR